jgi:tripeptide aminopeptidase
MKTNPLLIRTMQVQSESFKTKRMERFIIKELSKMNLKHKKDSYGNIYVTKGKANLYPTMVCHIDTVHKINDNIEVVQIEDKLLAIDKSNMKRYGIGGDDKVGIYITLRLLQTFDNFKAVFFLDEEVGCKGSSEAEFTFFDDSTIVLECDRRGIDDFVTSISGTKLSDDKLLNDIDDILKKYDRKKVNGGITDVGEIAEKNKVQVANMSCGYYDPHSDNEYIVITEVESTLDMCHEILLRTEFKRYEIDLENRVSYYRGVSYGGYGEYGVYGGYDSWDNDYIMDYDYDEKEYKIGNFKTTCECPECGDNEVWYEEETEDYFCLSCNQYVEVDEYEVQPDVDFMYEASNEELLEVDDLLYDMHLSDNEFKKNVEPKYIKNDNNI